MIQIFAAFAVGVYFGLALAFFTSVAALYFRERSRVDVVAQANQILSDAMSK